MKKLYNYITLFAALSATLLTGCKKEDIEFEHEKPQFQIEAEAILLEVIAPTGTAADELLYITGEFNGGDMYQLTKAEKSNMKWGIYLYAEDFAEGKSLKDGFTFVSGTNGKAYTAKGVAETWTLDAAYGTRTNVWVNSWEAFFKSGEEKIEHDGHVVYVIDETGWDALAMYAWGDAEAFGGWPGMEPTGKETVKGVEYIYFDLGEANEGLNLNLIFNNGGNGIQLGDFNFTVDRDVFLKLTANGAEEITPADGDVWPSIKHDGDAVYVCNIAGWEAVNIYMWGSTNDLNGGWPGMAPTGSFSYKGFDWYYFDLGAANAGQEEHLIVNNGNGVQLDDIVVYTLTGGDSTFYFILHDDKNIEKIADPKTYEYPSIDPEPDPEPGRIDTVYITVKDTITTNFYFVDESTINMHFLYAWGTDELFGGWPGVKWAEEWETATFLGKEFRHFEFKAEYGSEYNLIFTNKGYELPAEEQKQYDALNVKVGAKTDYFYAVGDSTVVEMKPTAEQVSVIRRLFRK